MERKSELIELAGLWANKDQNGEIVSLGGSLGRARLLVIPNKYKKESNHPDYKLFVTPQKEREQQLPQVSYDETDLPF